MGRLDCCARLKSQPEVDFAAVALTGNCVCFVMRSDQEVRGARDAGVPEAHA